MERGILAWIIIGLIAGAIAKLIMPGKDPGGIIVTIILGILGSILGGWLASMVMRTDAQQGMFLNVIVGIVGALLGGWLLAPLFGTGTINQDDFSISSLVVSFLGAIVLLMIVNLFRRGRIR